MTFASGSATFFLFVLALLDVEGVEEEAFRAPSLVVLRVAVPVIVVLVKEFNPREKNLPLLQLPQSPKTIDRPFRCINPQLYVQVAASKLFATSILNDVRHAKCCANALRGSTAQRRSMWRQVLT